MSNNSYYAFVNILDNNIGDNLSSPCHYYSDLASSKRYNLADIKNNPELLLSHKKIIIGGGAIGTSAIKLAGDIKELSKDDPVGVYLWGVGSTSGGVSSQTDLSYNRWTDLSGIRDVRSISRSMYVPCASCKSHYFLNASESNKRYDYVVYDHKLKGKLINAENAPSLSNIGNTTLRDVINLFSMTDTVVTSSYHGMYWAMLLGKKVIVAPFGSKFFGFGNVAGVKYLCTNDEDNTLSLRPIRLSKEFVDKVRPNVGVSRSFYDQCVVANDTFCGKVLNHIVEG